MNNYLPVNEGIPVDIYPISSRIVDSTTGTTVVDMKWCVNRIRYYCYRIVTVSNDTDTSITKKFVHHSR
jgi:hypothetical protein